MVKKRKLRSSAPESSNPNTEPEQSQSQSQPQPQHPQVEQEQEQIEQQEQQQTIEEEDEEETEKQEEAQGQHMEEEDNNKEKDREEEKEDEGGDDQTVNPSSTKSTEPAEEELELELEMEMEEEAVEKILEPFSKEQLALLLKEAVSKHPEFVESVEKLADADPARRKIFVHGLGWDSNTDTLNGVFGKYGEIEDCKAVCDKVSGKSKGYGFILYKKRSGARKALKQPQKKIGNRITSCQLASDGPPTSVPTAPPPPPPPTTASERKIFVSNVSAELDPQKLLDFFSKFGEIEDGPLGLDRQTGKPKGFALFVYKTADGAKKALDDPHKNYEGHILHCQKAIDGPKHSKSSFYQQQQQQQQQQQHPSFHHHSSARKDKAKYSSAAPGGGGMGTGHLMAPSVGYNPPVALAAPSLTPALGQALTALLATQGAGFGITNLLGRGLGAPVNQGVPPMMNNAGYGNPVGGAGGYGNQPVNMQGGGGYQNTQMGQGGPGRSQPGGAPYSGHGH